MFKSILIFSAFFVCLQQTAYTQFTLNDCTNLGFETGTLQAWSGEFGTWGADLLADSIMILSENYGLDGGRHLVHHISEGNVPDVTDEAIPFVPPGSEYAVQLGNNINGAQYERLRTSFLVDSANTLFQYRFAVIFEDPNHTPIEQPKFELLVTDQQGDIVPCGFYRVTSAGQIDGFRSQGNLRYRNWTTAGVDLRAYVGQVVTVQISTYDCSQGGHWGMALFDASCFSAGIRSVNYCPGVDNQITLEAPDGFQDYRWSNGATTRTITAPNPVAGQEFTVEYSPYSTLSDSCRLSSSFNVPAYVDVLPNQYHSFCGNVTTQLVPSLVGDEFQYVWSPGGATSKVLSVNQPGLYTVKVGKTGGCALFDTIVVEARPVPKLTLDFTQPSCGGKNDGSVRALADAPEPVRFFWNTLDTTALLQNLPAGLFRVTVTGRQSGCTATGSQLLELSEGVRVKADLLRLPLCENWQGGEALAAAQSGTPPYTYQWSTGAQENKSTLLTVGRIIVTVTDAKGCRAMDSLWVEPLRGATETHGNICHNGLEGSIDAMAFGGFPPYRFALGDKSIFQQNPHFEALASGAYTIRVQDQSGCVRSFPAEVKNLRPEPLQLFLVKDTAIVVGEYLDLSLRANYPLKSLSWSNDCGEVLPDLPDVRLRPFEECAVSVTALDTFGCPAAAALEIRVKKDYHLFIPNVFMPPGEFKDSRFYASVSPNQYKTVHSFRIFDRWGSLVFEDFDYHPNEVEEGWTGDIGARAAPPGVYVYTLDIEFVDGFRKVYAGDVTLLR